MPVEECQRGRTALTRFLVRHFGIGRHRAAGSICGLICVPSVHCYHQGMTSLKPMRVKFSDSCWRVCSFLALGNRSKSLYRFHDFKPFTSLQALVVDDVLARLQGLRQSEFLSRWSGRGSIAQ